MGTSRQRRAARRKCKIMSHCVRPRCGGDRLHSPSDRRRGPCAAAALHARRVLESVKFDVCPSVRVRVRVRSSVFRRRRSAAARPPLLFRKDTRSIHPSIPGGTKSREEGRKKEGDPSDPRVRARPPLRVAREEGSKLSPGRPGHRGSFPPSALEMSTSRLEGLRKRKVWLNTINVLLVRCTPHGQA